MKKLSFLFLSILLASSIFAQSETNWAKTAVTDLDYMHQMYRDNHAGGVDPENPTFNKKLEKEYKKARKNALKAKTEFDYQKSLRGFLTPFKDGHMSVWFNNKEYMSSFIKKSSLKNFKQLRKPISIENFADNSAWVYINTFNEKEGLFSKLVPELKKLKNKDIIVFDVRYNGGGSSYNGELLLSALYGKQYIDYVKQQVFKDEKEYYRATEWSLKSFKEAAKFYDVEEQTKDEIACLADAIADGKDICWYKEEKENISSAQKEPVAARVYVLTDNVCFSACLDFMDIIKGIGNITQIGQATDGDTKYMQKRDAELPSGLGKFSISYNGYINRPRKDNETYKPDYKFKGDMDDTKAIQEWIIKLDKKIQDKK
ncbi:hypothetical protein AAIR98_001814 [Elusimicrobium simillimum]|uniref:S41 family peptidase n=1 Tax=Elusimicrobium simillimum TaxID=3143438 RepID=UPI003C6EE29B